MNLQISFSSSLTDTAGLLVAGGSGVSYLAEFWSPEAEETQCDLRILKRDMSYGPTLNLVNGIIFACFAQACDILTAAEEGWQSGPSTIYSRRWHTSAVTPQGLLLVGGFDSSNTTELLPLDGGDSQESFTLSPSRDNHCSIHVDESTIVLIGGKGEGAGLSTEYSGLEGENYPTVKQLPELIVGREGHACGSYKVEERQFLIVAGGFDGNVDLDSTEVLDYTSGGGWRRTGPLPSLRFQAQGANVNGVFHVVGGYKEQYTQFSNILAWDAVGKTFYFSFFHPIF